MTGEVPLKIPQAGTGVRSGSRWWPLVAAAGYLGVALALLWPLPLRLSRDMAGEPFGDPILNAWILGWGADRLAAGLQGFWNAPIFYPYSDTLAWSEHLLGITVFVAPVYWLTQNVVLTHNVAMVGSIVLAGVGVYLLVIELTGSRWAGWIAGLAFACLPYRSAHITHLQILFAGWMPVALYGLHRFVRDGSRRGLICLAGGYVATALSNGYYLFYFSPALIIAAAWLLIRQARQGERLRSRLVGLTIAACLVVAAIMPVAAAYLRVRDTLGFSRQRNDMIHFAARPVDYLKVSRATVWHGVLPEADGERELFPGLTLTALAIAGTVAGRRRSDVRLYATIAVVAFVMTLGPTPEVAGHEFSTGPYDWFRLLPGVGGLRVPARFVMVMYLAMTVLAGFAVALAGRTASRRLQIAGAAVLCAALFVEGRPTVAMTPTTRPLSRAETAYRWLQQQPRGAMLELPVGRTAQAARYLPGTLVHGNRTVNGYSGYASRLADFFGGPPTLEPSHAASLVDGARAVGVRYLLVHQHDYPDRLFGAQLIDALRALGAERVEAFRLLDTTAILTLRPDATVAIPPADPPLTADRCTAHGFPNAANMERALDANVDTRWVSGGRQQGDEWLAIRCQAPRVVTSLTFEMARRSLGNYPRRLVVEASTDGESFRPVYEGSVVPLLARALATTTPGVAVTVPVEPGVFREVRLRQTARAERDSFWAVDEVRLNGRP